MLRLRCVPTVLITLILGGLVVVAVPPAVASVNGTGPYGTLKVADKTTNGTTCVTEMIEFVPAEALTDWTLDVELTDSNGDRPPRFSLDPTTPQHPIVLCPHQQRAGVYRVSGYLEGTTDSGQATSAFFAEFTFRVIDRKPTALTVKTARSTSQRCPGFELRPKHCSLVVGTLTRASKPLAWDYVQIEAYKRGKWVRQAWGRTNGVGRVSWYVTITRRQIGMKFRLRYETNDYAKGSVSRAFTLRY